MSAARVRRVETGPSVDTESTDASATPEVTGLSGEAEDVDPGPGGVLMTVEQVVELWFGVKTKEATHPACQRVRRVIGDPEDGKLPARRIGKRWYVNRAAAEAWAAQWEPVSVMAHPDSRDPAGSPAAAAGGRR